MLQPWDVPPELECLLQAKYLRFRNKTYAEKVDGRTLPVKQFMIQNSSQQDLFFCRQVASPLGHKSGAVSLITVVVNNNGQEVMTINRLRCCTDTADCGLQMTEVKLPGGRSIGYVRMESDFCLPLFYVENEKHHLVFCINPSYPVSCVPRCLNAVKIPIFTRTWQKKVGEISTKIGEYNYETVFPVDLEVRMKAVLIASTLALDYYLFT